MDYSQPQDQEDLDFRQAGGQKILYYLEPFPQSRICVLITDLFDIDYYQTGRKCLS